MEIDLLYMDYLKILIIILLVSFLLLSTIFKYSDCNKCSFEINKEKLNYAEFYSVYVNSCFNKTNEFNLTCKE